MFMTSASSTQPILSINARSEQALDYARGVY
jgi:hypothetical protein